LASAFGCTGITVYYLPNFADYADYKVEDADKSLSLGGFMQWALSSFNSVEEVLINLNSIKVVKVDGKEFGRWHAEDA